MVLIWIITILITLSVSNADGVSTETYNNNYQETMYESNPRQDIILAALSIMKTDIYGKLEALEQYSKISESLHPKLDVMDKKIIENFALLENKLSKLEKQHHDMEENVQDMFLKLEKNMIHKLEDYVDGKFELLEKHINRKIDAHEATLSDKADVHIINKKLDLLKNIQPALNGNTCGCNTMANETLQKMYEEISQMFPKIQENSTEVENAKIDLELDALNNNLTMLENFVIRKWTDLKDIMVPEIQDNIKRKLDLLEKNIQKYLDENIKPKLDTMDNHILSFKIKLAQDTCPASNDTSKQNNMPVLTQINKAKDEVSTKVNKNYYRNCKEQELHDFNYKKVEIDKLHLNHVTLETNADGLTYFEMNLAIRAHPNMLINLCSSYPYYGHTKFELNVGDHFSMRKRGDRLNTFYAYQKYIPNILSSTRYTLFYLRIVNQTLEFGEIGSPPIVQYRDDRLKTIKFIDFSAGPFSNGTVLYDCELY